MNKTAYLGSCFVLLYGLGRSAEALPILVVNPSFESGTSTNGTIFSGAPTGWTFLENGVVSTNDTQADGLITFEDPGPNVVGFDGSRMLGIRDRNGTPGGAAIEQELSTFVVPGLEYQLSFLVADRILERWLNYTVELVAGVTTIISEDSATNALIRPANGSTSHPGVAGAEGDAFLVTLFGTASLLANPADQLKIRFASSLPSIGDDTPNNVDDFAIDLVELSSVDTNTVPEPASVVLFGLTAVGLFGVRVRRRRKQRAA